MSPRVATAGIFFVNGAVIGSWAAHIPFVRDHLDVSKTTIGLCLLAMAAVNRRVGRTPLVRGGLGMAAVALGAALLAGAPWAAIPALVLVGLGVANAVPLFFSAAARIPGMDPGPGMAAVTTTGYLGLLAGPPLLGILADATSLPTALGLTAVLTAGAALACGPALAGTERTGLCTTLMLILAALSFFLSALTPIRLEPMPASQAKMIVSTFAAGIVAAIAGSLCLNLHACVIRHLFVWACPRVARTSPHKTAESEARQLRKF